MSRYTEKLQNVCEYFAGVDEFSGYSSVESTIQAALPKIFDFTFPIFDETYRNVLETKIIRHYYTREIGQETIGLWKLKLNTKLNEIMPYYNQLYNSAKLEFDPFGETKLTKSGNRQNDGGNDSNSTGTQNATNTNKDMFADTPQNSIAGIEAIENDNYLTSYEKVTQDNTGDSSSTFHSTLSNTEDYTETLIGKQSGQSMSKMLTEFRETLLNIDMQIINDLNDLFFGLWEVNYYDYLSY